MVWFSYLTEVLSSGTKLQRSMCKNTGKVKVVVLTIGTFLITPRNGLICCPEHDMMVHGYNTTGALLPVPEAMIDQLFVLGHLNVTP